MSRLVVKNWEKFQHYKKRSPPWIKLATDVFQNDDFTGLPTASKLLAICIWTLASKSKDGSVVNRFDHIKHWGFLGDDVRPEHLKALIDNDFLSVASTTLAPCKQNATPEERRDRGETEESEDFLKAKNRLIEEITTICRQELKLKAEREFDSIWERIGELQQDHSSSAVALAFTRWAQDNKGTETKTPVADFYFARDQYLDPDSVQSRHVDSGTIAKAGAGETDTLCQLMHESSRQSFTGKQRHAVTELLTEFPADEILAAWKDYISPMDDNDLRFATKKFCEGAGRDWIGTRRKEATKRAAQDVLQNQLLQNEQRKAAQELAELRRAEEMEIEEPLS